MSTVLHVTVALLAFAMLTAAAIDETVSSYGTCRTHTTGSAEKFKCSPARANFGKGLPAFNVTGTTMYSKKACKRLAKASSLGMLLVTESCSSSCAYSKIVENAAAAGYSGVIVLENRPKCGKNSKSKPEPGFDFGLPVVTVDVKKNKRSTDQLRKQGTRAEIVVKSLKKVNGVFMDGPSLYTKSKTSGAEEDIEAAVRYAQWSVQVDPRAYTAHYALANYLHDLNRKQEVLSVLEKIINVPSDLYSRIDSRLAECSAERQEQLKQAVEAKAGGKPPRVHVVTVATAERPELELLRQSVLKSMGADTDFVVLGLGHVYSGLGFKLVMMLEWIASIPDDDFVLFTDAYDVIFLRPASELLARYYSFCSPLVFGAELACNPDYSLQAVLPTVDASPLHGHPMPYLNSGTYIGPAVAVKKMLVDVERDIDLHFARPTGGEVAAVNDQRWFWRHWLLHPDELVIDTRASLFHTLHGTGPDDYTLVAGTDGTVWSNITGTMPALAHGNGEGKDALNAIVKLLYTQDWLHFVEQTEQYHGGIHMMK